MELNIGDIKQVDGEWYQCYELGKSDLQCDNCDLFAKDCHSKIGHCFYEYRHDNKNVVFKKLEKIGKPFERNGYMYQEYKIHTYPLLMNGDAKIPTPNGFAVIIKQNKDMEEKKLNLKPFNLEAAKSGKPVCTRDGRKARIICFDSKNDSQRPIVALVEDNGKELLYEYTIKGKEQFSHISTTGTSDLMMLPEKKEGWVNIYKGNNGISKYDCDDIVFNIKEEAIQYAQNDDKYITTVKISWEE